MTRFSVLAYPARGMSLTVPSVVMTMPMVECSPDHPAGAGLSGKVKGYFLVEPRTFDHAGLFVFLVAHGPLHHIAHTVDEPYPTDTTAF